MSVVQLNPRISILQRSWGEESVVYVIDTGATHLLNAAAGRLIESLGAGSLTLASVAASLPPESDDADLEELLDGLCSAGLIELAGNAS